MFTIPFSMLQSSEILFFSDSQSVLTSLKNYNHENSIIQQILQLYKVFGLILTISIKWCPGHKGILGNELADYFAKSSYSCKNTKHFDIPYPLSSLKSTVRTIHHYLWQAIWNTSSKGRTMYEFFQSVKLPKFYEQSNSDHKLTQILTGHCKLNLYLQTIQRAPSSVCSCNTGIQSIDHYLFHCPNEHYNRQQTMIPASRLLLLSFPPSKKDVASNELLFYALKTFLKNSKRLDYDR